MVPPGKQFFNTPREEETENNTTFQKEENFENENILIDDKPTSNINKLQSIRIDIQMKTQEIHSL